MKIAVVVPSCREGEAQEFIKSWKTEFSRENAELYLVEDNQTKTFKLPSDEVFAPIHLSWEDAPTELLETINVRSPGCRQIGFWKAYKDHCDIIITLDDDVRPVDGSSLVGEFVQVLAEGVPAWVDPLLNYRSRGYPVRNFGRISVNLHVGSFLGVPDVDAETQLRHFDEFAQHPPRYQQRTVVVPAGQFIPINGGIVGWRRELTPYVHYTLWDAALQYRRFDDIWMGVILKLVLDLSGGKVSYGPPVVNHQRASDAVKNLEYERVGKEWNEVFWEILTADVARRAGDGQYTLDEAFTLVAEALTDIDSSWAKREAAAMLGWRSLFPSYQTKITRSFEEESAAVPGRDAQSSRNQRLEDKMRQSRQAPVSEQ